MTPKTNNFLRSWLTVSPLEDRTVPATLVDHNSTFTAAGNGDSQILGVSDDGRYAIFSSTSTNLVQGQIDTPGTKDLFWTDQLTGEIKLVTNLPSVQADTDAANTSGTTNYQYDGVTTFARALGSGDAFSQAVISGDGQSVAYNTLVDASLLDKRYITQSISPTSKDITRTIAPDRGNTTLDVFKWASKGGESILASRSYYNATGLANTRPANPGSSKNPNQAFGSRTDSFDPAISTDGTRVSFVSKFDASAALPQRVVAPPPNANTDVDLGNQTSGFAQFLALDNGDTSDDIFMTDFTMLDNASFVAPQESETGGYATTVMSKVYSKNFSVAYTNRVNGVVTFSAPYKIYSTFGSASTQQIGVDSLGRYLSGDGLTVSFTSNASPSLLNFNNTRTYAASSATNVYWVNFGSTDDPSNNVRLVTTGADTGTTGTVTSSGGGGGAAQNAVVARNDPFAVLFLTNTGGVQIVPGFSGDASQQQLYFRRMVAEIGDPAVLVTAISGQTATPGNGVLPVSDAVNGTIDPTSYQLAGKGTFAVYTSTSSNTFPAATLKDTNKANDVFRKDLVTGAVSAVSVRAAGKQTGAAGADTPYIGADGRYVTFQSAGTDYVTGITDTNAATDVFLRDTTAAATTYVSLLSKGASAGNGKSYGGFVGTTGVNNNVFFTSAATDLDPLTLIGTTGSFVQPLSSAIGPVDPTLKVGRIGAVGAGSPGSAAYVSFGTSGDFIVGDRFSPFPGFTGEIRVATADVNGDAAARPDLIVAPGPGTAPRVVVIDGDSGKTIYNILAFEQGFTGGLNVAAADINADGKADIIVAADTGGGPRLKVIDGATGNTLTDLFVFESSFRGGVRLGTGYIGSLAADGSGQSVDDNVPDIVAGAGIGGGPRVSILDGASLAAGRLARVSDYFAYEQTLRNGVYVAAGDFNKDTLDDVVTGAGPGGGPRVQVFDAKSVVRTPNTPTVLVNFFGFADSSDRNGVRVAAKNVDGDSVADIVVGEGAGNIGRIRSFAGGRLDANSQPALIGDTVPFDDFAATNGAWVG